MVDASVSLSRRMHKQAAGRKKEVKLIKMTKSKRGTSARPRGPYKVVDNRLKKDIRATKANERRASGKKAKTGKRPMHSANNNKKKSGGSSKQRKR